MICYSWSLPLTLFLLFPFHYYYTTSSAYLLVVRLDIFWSFKIKVDNKFVLSFSYTMWGRKNTTVQNISLGETKVKSNDYWQWQLFWIEILEHIIDTSIMNDFPNIWFVDSHSKCYCCNNTLGNKIKRQNSP